MEMPKTYAEWEAKIESLKNQLLERDTLLRQYAIWLETSEENNLCKGEDVYHMLVGVLQGQGLSNVNFIPGVGWRNFVAVIGKVQKETGLDLGVCRFLDDNIIEIEKEFYSGEKPGGTYIPECTAKENLLISGLSACIPPNRYMCPYRKAKLEQIASQD